MKRFSLFPKSKTAKIANRVLLFVSIIWASIVISPNLLAFPYHAQIGDTEVYSETPIGPNMKSILTRSDALFRQSKIWSKDYGKTLYLTEGGWRWNMLALTSRNSFAFGRPVTHALVFNHSDIAADKIFSLAADGRTRSLAGTIAHERTHHLITARIGLWQSIRAPTWKVEGYCDHVAQDGSLNDAQAAALAKTNPDHPALVYHYGRKRVAAILAKNGGSVDQLFKD